MGKAEFEPFKGEDNQYYFRLRAANGEIVAGSEAYGSPEARDRGIEAAKRAALAAMGINPRKRLMVGSVEIRELTGERDGELETSETPAAHYVEADPDVELPL